MTQPPKTNKPSYGNFKNPFGLLYRMLTSGKRPAYSALFREGLGIAARPIDAVLALRERKTIQNATGPGSPLILIVGPPRSGTTLVYQAFAYCLDVTFPSNLSSVFGKSPMTVNRFAGKQSADFGSYFGQTSRMSGPNDAFHIWNRWLGEDRYTTRTDLSPEEILSMRQFFTAWTDKFDKPFLNKNNRNVQCISYLAEHLPNAFFVGVLRDPACVARSLIHARKAVQGDTTTGWGLQCQEKHCHEYPLGYVQDVCDQVMRNQSEQLDSFSKLSPERFVQIQYEQFCDRPDEIIDEVVAHIPQLQRRKDSACLGKGTFCVSRSVPLSDTEEEIIRKNFPADGI